MVTVDPNSPPSRPAQVKREDPNAGAKQLERAYLQAWGKQFIRQIVRQVVQSITNTAIDQMSNPLPTLQSWGQTVQDQAQTATDMLSGISPGAGAVAQYVQDQIAGIVTTGLNWAEAGLALFGIPGMSQTDYTTASSSLMALLGNPSLLPTSGSFDPVASAEQMLQNVLTPAGALTSWTPIPAHLFANIAPGSAGQNALPDPGFDDPADFEGQGLWFHDATVGRTVESSVVGSIKTTAASALRVFYGVPVPTAPGQVTQLGSHFYWTGLTSAAGQQVMQVCGNAYDAADNLIESVPLMWITAPGASSASYAGEPALEPPPPAHGADGWVYLSGNYKAPAGTVNVRVAGKVLSSASAGTVWADDLVHIPEALVDAAHLGNWDSLAGVIPTPAVQGFQGLEDMLTTLAHTFDGLGSAFNQGTDLSGVTPPQLFGLAQDTASQAALALQHAVNAINILGKRSNRPAPAGLDPTSVPSFHLLSGDGAITSNMTAVPAGSAIIATALRLEQDMQPGAIEFLAFGNGGAGIITNLYKITNAATGDKTLLWTSPDLGTLVPNGTQPGYVRALIPNASQPMLKAGDTLAVGIANNGAGTLSVHTKARGTPNHPTVIPKNFGGTRTLASTGGVSPAALADSAITYSGTVPHVNLTVANVPKAVIPPVKYKFPTPGQVTIPIPVELQVDGTLIFLSGLGGGGSGMSEWDAGIMAGGLGGAWQLLVFVYGHDVNATGYPVIPSGTTQLIGVVGAGGPQCTGYWQNGNPGGNTQVWLGAVGTGTLLLDAAGGEGGNNSIGFSPGTGYGPTPSQQVVDTTETMFAGGNVGINSPGAAPGGGGGGATWYEFGGRGAPGELWAKIRQPS